MAMRLGRLVTTDKPDLVRASSGLVAPRGGTSGRRLSGVKAYRHGKESTAIVVEFSSGFYRKECYDNRSPKDEWEQQSCLLLVSLRLRIATDGLIKSGGA